MFLEQGLDFISGCPAIGNFDTICGTGGDVNHFPEFEMIKCLNRLRKGLLLEGGRMDYKTAIETYLVSRY